MTHQHFAAILILSTLAAPSLSAKPLLLNSESTYGSACIDADETPERLVQICDAALAQSGATQAQRLEMMENLAWAYADLDNRDAAIGVFNDMLGVNAASAKALNGLGWMAWEIDDFEHSLGYFERALASEYSAEALAGVAVSRLGTGLADATETLQTLEAASAIDPEYIWPVREIGWIHLRAGENEKSEAAFRRAVDMNEDSPYGHYGLSKALHELNRFEDALDHINIAIGLGVEHLDYYNERAVNLLFLSRYQVAENEADRMIEKWPDGSEGYVMKARARFDRGAGADAISGLKAYVDANPDRDWPRHWLARLYELDGQHDLALEYLLPLQAGDDTPGYHFSMVFRNAYELERYDVARAATDGLLQNGADPSEAAYFDGVLKALDKEFDAAEQQVEEALRLGRDLDDLEEFYSLLAKSGEFVRLTQFKIKAADAAKAGQTD